MSSAATSAPRPMPALARIWDGEVVPLDVDRLVRDADVVFLALPEAASAELAPTLLERGVRVIDLSGAFRIRAAGRSTALVPGDRRAARRHGLRDDRRESGRHTRRRGWSRIQAATRPRRCSRSSPWPPQGSSTGRSSWTRSRASRAPARRRQIARTSRRITAASPAYAVFSHRHTAEIEQELGRAVTFVPHLVPLDRGILETIYGSLTPGTTEPQVADALAARVQGRAVRPA